MEKKRGRAGAFFLSGLMCLTSLAGLSGSARAAGLEAKCLVPVGHTIGIKLFAEGVVVIGLSEVETASGVAAPGAACGLKVGDVIEEANREPVESSEQFARLLQCGGRVELAVSRDGEDLRLTAEPVLSGDGTYRLGAWIRDSMAGIGTVTFYDPETGAFGALGHGITDSDTRDAPSFGTVWSRWQPWLDSFQLIAHNAAFDSRCIRAACRMYGLDDPAPFRCTLSAARRTIPRSICQSKSLDSLCDFFGIPLKKHHCALDDALACARLGIILL